MYRREVADGYAITKRFECPHWNDLVRLPSPPGGWSSYGGMDCHHVQDVPNLGKFKRTALTMRSSFKMP